MRARPRKGRGTALRLALFTAAGPAASLGFAVACVAGALWLDPTRAPFHLLLAGALASTGGFLLSVIPSRLTGLRMAVDGDVLRQVLRGGFWFTPVGTEVASAIGAGVRAREWTVTAEEIERAAASAARDQLRGRFVALLRRLDGGDPEASWEAAARLLEERLDPLLRRELLLQVAMMWALMGGGPPGPARA